MSEPRRSTRTRAREEAASAPAPESPKETPSKTPAKSLKRKRTTAIAKDSAPATPVTEASQQTPKQFLPIRVVEGQPLPTLSEPQPLDLSAQEYQDIQQSGVLSVSLQRSRALWISGSNFRLFHAFFAPPKKVADRTEEDKQAIQRQKEIIRNFPQLGGSVEAQLVIEPHTFPIRLYGPREIVRQVQKKPPPPPQYGQWPNHNQQPPYQQQQYHNSPAPYSKSTTPQQRPSQPKPQPRPPQQAPGPSTPAPDPVIHMLAQRAGTDPELKAVMRVVAAGNATQEQLEFFQGHIAELTNLLQKQKDAAAKAPPAPPPPPPPPPQQTPQPVVQPQQQPNAPTPYPAPGTPTPTPHQHMAPAPPQHTPHANQYTKAYNQPQQHMSPYSPAPQPPRTSYRPLIFDFVEGNGDKYYFPSYSFMEWLPSNQGVKFSFLITKMKPKPKEEPKPEPATPAPKATPAPTSGLTPVETPNAPASGNANATPNQSTPGATPIQPAPATPAPPVTQYVAAPRIEDFDEKKDIKDIEFYQPVTVVILSNNFEILQSLPRAVRPPDIVEKYMNEIFDNCTRADETYLAFRLPKEGVADGEGEVGRVTESVTMTPAVSTPNADVVMGGTGASIEKKRGAGRPRKSLLA